MAQNVLGLLRGARFSLPHPLAPAPQLMERKNWQRSMASGWTVRKSDYNDLPFHTGKDTCWFFSRNLGEADPRKNSKCGGSQHPHFSSTKRLMTIQPLKGVEVTGQVSNVLLGLREMSGKEMVVLRGGGAEQRLHFHCAPSKGTRIFHGWVDST